MARATDFRQIPGWPVAYDAMPRVREAFEKFPPIKKVLNPKQGTSTGDDEMYVRYWFEVPRGELGLGIKSLEESQASSFKYFPLDKGGEFRKWYGDNRESIAFRPTQRCTTL